MTDSSEYSRSMDAAAGSWVLFLLVLAPIISGAWRDERRDPRELREMKRSGIHYHTKRHMLSQEPEAKKRTDRSTMKPQRELRKKPSGNLAPLAEDDIENDEVISVAIGPPPIRPKFEKHRKQQPVKQTKIQPPNSTAVDLVRDVLGQIGKEFLTREINENFVFGQYVGNSMKNLTSHLRLNMQHDILDLIMKYQNLNMRSNSPRRDENLIETKEKLDKKFGRGNETEEPWPDFSNLANIVG